MQRRTKTGWMLMALALAAGLAGRATAQQLEPGLVTALDRIGGNLLGASAFDAVLQEPPDPVQPPLRIYLSAAQSHPVEIILVTANPPEPVRAFFRVTVGASGGLKLEFDPNAGDIIPCITPADLTGFPAAPADSGNGTATWRAGLVTALDEVGGNLLGAGQFDAVLANPPDPIEPQRLRLFVSRTSPIEFVLSDPPDPIRVLFRMVVGGEEVELLIPGGGVGVAIEEADLSDIDPPDPV
jgi:hypothetical protein